MNFDHLNGRIRAAHNNPMNPTGIANYVFEKAPEGFHHPYIGSIDCVDDPEMDYIKRRMVACWNACQGARTDVLERGAVHDWGLLMTQLESERDVLLEAINQIAKFKVTDFMGPHDMSLECVIIAKTALTKITTPTT